MTLRLGTSWIFPTQKYHFHLSFFACFLGLPQLSIFYLSSILLTSSCMCPFVLVIIIIFFHVIFCSMCLGVSNWTVICFYQQAKQNLGPGEYDLKSFLHELNGSYLKLFSSWNFSFFVYFDLVHFYCHVYFLSFSVLSDKHKNHHGAFLKVERFPAYPTNRVYCSTLSQYPRDPVSLLSDQVPPAKYKVNWELEWTDLLLRVGNWDKGRNSICKL